MHLVLILPWFPIILGVGVGGRLLGPRRGLGLGVLGALFWIVLVQAACAMTVWEDPWMIGSLVAGGVAIVAMGAWSGTNHGAPFPVDEGGAGRSARPSIERDVQSDLSRIAAAIERFDDWLDEHRDDANPWPAFDQFIRDTLHRCCGATHVRPYRVLADRDELAPIGETDPLGDDRLDARRGIIGHVVTTGRTFVHGDPAHGELIERIAAESTPPPAWCFAVTQGVTREGVVSVGRLPTDPASRRPMLYAVERLVRQCWNMLGESRTSWSASRADPVTGLRTRAAFFREAERSLRSSYDLGEPVAVAVIAIEGLRDLNDSGRWESADHLLSSVGESLRRKLRVDDCVGRLDDARFLLLLRRVDSELASLIVHQLATQLQSHCGEDSASGGSTVVRCGLTGSGTGRPELDDLVRSALRQYRRAREEQCAIATDLEPRDRSASAGATGEAAMAIAASGTTE